MREPDGTTLEEIIGELQSNWGVPEFPQEFRITVKVSEDKESRGERTVELAEDLQDPEESTPDDAGRPRREKAPAAPRMAGGAVEREQAPGRRRRGRRRRRGGRGKGGPGGAQTS